MMPPKESPHPSSNTLARAAEGMPEKLHSAGQEMLTIYSRLLTMLGIFAAFTSGFYLTVYASTGIPQAMWAAIPILGTVLFIPLAYTLAKRGTRIQAGVLTLLGVSLAYGLNELLWTGLTPYHIVGGVFLILLTGMLILPQDRQVWITAIGLYLLYILLAFYLHPVPRYPVSNLPALLPYAIGTNIMLVLALATLSIRSLRTRSIATRLLITFIVLVLTPLILSSIISSILSAQNARQRIYAQLESVVTLKDSEINAWVNNLKTNLMLAMPASGRTWVFASSLKDTEYTSLAHQPFSPVGSIETDLKKLVAQSPVFKELYLLNSQGRIFISSNDSFLNANQAEAMYFKEGLNNTYITPLQETPKLGDENASTLRSSTLTVIISTPVADENGETVGVLAGLASLDTLSEIMYERTGLGRTGETYLINPEAILVTASHFQGYRAGEKYRFADVILDAMDKGVSGKATYRSYRGATVLGAYRWQPVLQLLMIAENEQTEALMSIYQTLGINLGVAAIAALFALGAGWYAARGITEPLARLSKTAEAIASGKLNIRAEIEQEDEVGALAQSLNSMNDQLRLLLEGLENRIAERTREVERRSLQLQVAAEVARDATATRDLIDLLNRAVNLVSENFGFYHAGIFLIDDRGEYAVLRAATGEVGKQMLREGHKLAVSQSEGKEQRGLVGHVGWSGVSRIASDVDVDAVHFKNPLLPDTRSEVALPLKVSNRVIGVLDVQSTDEDAFNEENVRILQTLADQLATAIENARLFQEMSQTVQELETVYGQYTREAWSRLKSRADESKSKPISDYRYRGLTIETISEPAAVATEALESGHTVVKTEPDQSALAIPLRLRGQTVGVVNLRFEGQALPDETVNTYEEIANRLVLVLENARLLQEAQQSAKREQQINLISTQIRSSATTDSILRNTVRELGNALGATRTFIQLGLQPSITGNDKPPASAPEVDTTSHDPKEHQE